MYEKNECSSPYYIILPTIVSIDLSISPRYNKQIHGPISLASIDSKRSRICAFGVVIQTLFKDYEKK